MNQKCHTLYFANILALWQVLLWCQIGAARRNQKVKNFKNFENRAHFSFNFSKTKSAKNFKLSHHVLCYLWLKKRDFFQSVLVFNWRLFMQKIVSIPFSVLRILTFFVFTGVATSNFSQCFCNVMENYPSEFSKQLRFAEKSF